MEPHTSIKLFLSSLFYQMIKNQFLMNNCVTFPSTGNATGANAISVLRQAIRKHGRLASILTDHGTQFYANESEYKRKDASEFEKELVRLDIKHILARVNHPQINGKLERFHGEIQRKQRWFDTVDVLIHWYNHIKPHISLDWDNLETRYKRL